MAKMPDENDKAQMVLDIYRHFGARPGHALMHGNFTAVIAAKNWSADDVAHGMEICRARGWVEDGPNNTLKLTEAGFAEM